MASAQGIKAGKAFIELSAHDTKLRAALLLAQKRLRAFGDAVQRVGLRLGAMGAAATGGLFAAAKMSATFGDNLNDMAVRTGLSVEALSELTHAANLSGASIETVETGVRRMQKTITAAAEGSTDAAEAFDKLGLSTAALASMNPEAQFKAVAAAVGKIEDPTARAAAALEVFGKSGTQLLPLIVAELDETMQHGRDLGLTFTGDMAARAAVLDDTLVDLYAVLRNVAHVVGDAVSPMVAALGANLRDATAAVSRWIKENRAAVTTFAQLAVGTLAVGAALVGVGVALKVGALAMGALSTAIVVGKAAFVGLSAVIAAIVSPIGLAVAGVAVLGGAILHYTGIGHDALSWLGDQFGQLASFVGGVAGGIRDALAAGDIQLAAQVLWAGLRVAWETGVASLRKIWDDFRFVFQTATAHAFAYVQTLWVRLRDWFETELPGFTALVSKAWAETWSTAAVTFTNFHHWLTDRWLDLMGLFDESVDVELAQTLNNSDLADSLAKIERDRAAAVVEADRRRGRSAEERAREYDAALDAIEKEKAAALAAANDTHTQRRADAAKELADAEARLEALKAEARASAAFADTKKPRPGASPFPGAADDDPFTAAAKATTHAISAVGSFSGADLSRLINQGETPGQRKQLALAEQANRYLKDIADRTKNIHGNLEY